MKLYDVPRKTYIKVNNEVFYFDHIDGMYSYCLDKNKNVIHLEAWTEIDLVEEKAIDS